MAAILVYERTRTCEIAVESDELRTVGWNTAAHCEITELATLGKSVIGWNEEDNRTYRAKRLRLDSLLLTLHRKRIRFVHPEQVNTLRCCLWPKRRTCCTSCRASASGKRWTA